jgi:predicted amidohydrolase
MEQLLTVGILQMPVSRDFETNYAYFEKNLRRLSFRNPRTELVIGVEGAVGYNQREKIPGYASEKLGTLARQYGIYFIPGTMYETADDCPEGKYYNAAPIFAPDGTLIDVYRKMAPWKPVEYKTVPGTRYVVFEIPEKKIKIGVLICYDLNFPEICRNLTLAGADVLVKLTEDPMEAYALNRPVHLTRAIENQVFLISANAAGYAEGFTMYGHSMVIHPGGQMILEAGDAEALLSVTIDVSEVAKARKYGTQFSDHYLQHLKEYQFPMPYCQNLPEAPVFKNGGLYE